MSSRIALLIGVGDYNQNSFSMLHTPPNGVMALEKVLSDPDIGHFDEVKSLINPDLTTMQQEIEDLFFHANKTDLVLLYFAGHGVKDEYSKLYLTNRSTIKYESGELKKSTAIRADFVIEVMSSSLASRQVIILDSCFSGAFPDGMFAMDDSSVDVENQFSGEGRAVLTATNSTHYALEREGEELSVYTNYLVEGLKTGSAAPDEKDTIHVIDLHEYTKSKVKVAAPSMNPEYYGVRDAGKILLAKAPVGDPELKFRKKVERRVHDGKISETGRRILAKEQTKLLLSEKRGSEIIQEVLRPFEKKEESVKEYREAFQREVATHFPLEERVYADLKDYQRVLNLRDEDVELVEEEVNVKNTILALQSSDLREYTQQRLPVTIVTGLLGSGKTTLINKMIEERNDLNIAIITGEYGEVDFSSDAEIFDYYHTNSSCQQCQAEAKKLLEDSISKVLSTEKRIDYLIIETAGYGDPLSIALTLLGTKLRDMLSIDSIISLIDAELYLQSGLCDPQQSIYSDIIVINKFNLVAQASYPC